MLNILIPMAGRSTFDVGNGNGFPKVLADVDGKLLVERSAEPFTSLPGAKKIVVVAPKDQLSGYKLDKILPLLDDSIEVCSISGKTQGAVCSAMLAIEHLDLEQPLIISSFEQVLDFDLAPFIDEFIASDADAGVLTFKSIHPKWSFVKKDDDGIVYQAAEKQPISSHAIAGFYFFKTGNLFIESAKNMIRNDVMHDGAFYTSHTLNEVILRKGKVLALSIDESRYFHISDDSSLENYGDQLKWTNSGINNSIYRRTLDYIEAFNRRSVEDVAQFFSEEFVLNEPSLNIQGKGEAVNHISKLFFDNPSLRFVAKNILVNRHISAIEFELTIENESLVGTDIISWNKDNQMIKLNAYINEKE